MSFDRRSEHTEGLRQDLLSETAWLRARPWSTVTSPRKIILWKANGLPQAILLGGSLSFLFPSTPLFHLNFLQG